MNIPVYPQFRLIEIDDADEFTKRFQENPPVISEFTFTNLYAWRRAYNSEAAALGDFLILRSTEKQKQRFFAPIGPGDKKAVIEKILQDTKGEFFRVPDDIRLFFENDSRFKIIPDRNNADYVYKANDLIALRGQKYDGKRNLIKKFKSQHTYEYIPCDGGSIRGCLGFEERWCLIKDCDSVESLSDERCAIREMMKNFSRFKLVGGMIKIEARICAIAIGQRLNSDTLVVHILKADPGIVGLYQVINNEFLRREAKDFTYVNMEQDMGVEGLRKAKLSYHPVRMIDKYTISL